MSSIENTANNLNAALAAIPHDELAAANSHIGQALDIISGIADIGVQWQMFPAREAARHGEQANEHLETGKAEISAYLAALGVTPATGEISETYGQTSETPAPIATGISNMLNTALGEMHELTKGGRYTYDSRTLEAMIEKAKTQATALQPAVAAALADPAQTAAVLDALQVLEFYRNHDDSDSIKTAKSGMLATLLYAGDSSQLASLAIQTNNPGLAERAMGLIIDTYAWSAYPAPEITNMIVKNYKNVLDCYTSKIHIDDGDEDFKNFCGRSNTNVALSRAIAEAPIHDVAVLMEYLQKGGDGPYPDRKIKDIGESAIIYLMQGAHQEEFIRKFDLDAEKVFDAWAAGYGGRVTTSHYDGKRRVYSNQAFLRRNIETMTTLEAKDPGICKVLADRLHIRSFARYSPDLLREAYAALSNPPDSYILAAIAMEDHNGAFSKDELEDIRAQIQQDNPDAVVIPVELDTIEDIWDIANDLRAQGWGPADHVLMSGHGTSKSTRLRKDAITIQGGSDTRSSWWALGRLVRNIVKEDGTFTFLSCSTGKGLAQHVSNVSGRTTQAPGEDVAVAKIDMVRDASGKLVPSPRYINSRTKQLRPTLTFTPQKGTTPAPPAGTKPPTHNQGPGIRITIPPVKQQTGLLKTIELLKQQ